MRKSSGFTLIEAVAVLIVLGILAVIVITKYTAQGTESAVDASILKDAIRQTQMRAMGRQCSPGQRPCEPPLRPWPDLAMRVHLL